MLDYGFYKEKYFGTLDESMFSKYKAAAEATINLYTFNRVKKMDTVPDEVKYCICELIDHEQDYQDSKNISSETVGTHTVSYRQESNSTTKNSIVKKWLAPTGLMFRGVRYDD